MSRDLPTIGYIGVGLMGRPMVDRLLGAGYEVVVWNRTRAKLDGVIARGAEAAATPSELAEQSDYVFMCLMDAKAIEAVVFGPDGVACSKRPKTLIDFGTIHPDTCRAFAKRLQDISGIGWIDAPVSGWCAGGGSGNSGCHGRWQQRRYRRFASGDCSPQRPFHAYG